MDRTAKLFHIAAFGFYFYVLYNINRNNQVEVPNDLVIIKNMRRFSLRYLTNWTFVLQTFYFGLCIMSHFLNLFFGYREVKQKVDRFSNFIFTAIATPMALMVTGVFWSIYLYDRELIFPKVIDLVMPPWINHSIHTFNTLLALVDIYLVNHRYPPWKSAAQGLLCYLVPYSICLFGTYGQTGIWLYPFLAKLTWTMRALFGIATYIGALLFFGLLKYMSYTCWGSFHLEEVKKKNKHKLKK